MAGESAIVPVPRKAVELALGTGVLALCQLQYGTVDTPPEHLIGYNLVLLNSQTMMVGAFACPW